MKPNAFRDELRPADENVQLKDGRPIYNGPVISFKYFMDSACNITKQCLSDFFSLAAKLTDFDTDCNQGWLYTEDNMTLYDKNMAYFNADEHGYYPIGDIEIFINTYSCINEIAGYLCGCFVASDSNGTDKQDCEECGTYFSNKFDDLYSVLCSIKDKLVSTIAAFQPDNELVASAGLEKAFDPGYMFYMDRILITMSDINILLSHCTSYIFGFEPVKDAVKND